MTPPTESELDKLQSRIDMREAAEDVLKKYGDGLFHWEARHMAAAVLAKHLLALLDDVEELETTIATQACDIAEYQRESGGALKRT